MTTMTHTEQLQHIVQAARLAPSVHNTQPWRFVEGDGSLELHADTSRQLPVLDPTGRQLHLSCGAALYQARVTARALGLDAAVELLPDSQQSTLLARLLLSQGAPPTVAEVATATAILHRHTFRGTFAAIAVPAELVAALRASAEAEGAVLDEVDRARTCSSSRSCCRMPTPARSRTTRIGRSCRRGCVRGLTRSTGCRMERRHSQHRGAHCGNETSCWTTRQRPTDQRPPQTGRWCWS